MNTSSSSTMTLSAQEHQKALGPTQSKKLTDEEIITDKGKQMERWVEYYSELYSRENVVVTSALNVIKPLPIMEEIDVEPTLKEQGYKQFSLQQSIWQ